jgi:hypothetical protein
MEVSDQIPALYLHPEEKSPQYSFEVEKILTLQGIEPSCLIHS